MCGIVGYTGPLKAQNILLDGLQRLEYRGYDSAGIAYVKDLTRKISVRKTAGKVKDLRAICDENDSTCGIGHTRWATHGGVSNANAHPHKCGNVALVHNGILENYRELIEEYSLQDKLNSETDTEVAAALLDHFYSGNPEEAIFKVTSLLKGTYGFVIMFFDRPGILYCIRQVSPLVATYCDDGAFVASDLTAFVSYSKKYFVLPEHTIMVMTDEGITLKAESGKIVSPEYIEVDWDVSAAEKDGYDYFMLKEIHEQPEAISRTIMPRIVDGLPSFLEDGIDDSLFENVKDITIVACGTAMYAGNVGRTLLQKRLRIPVTVAIASEFRYETPVIDENSLVIVVSQSGETVDTLEALRLAKKYTDRTLAIVNVKGSVIATEANYRLYTHAGPEIAVASTKAYTVQTAAFYLLTAKLGLVTGKMTEAEVKDFIGELLKVPEQIKKTLALEPTVERFTGRMLNAEHTFFIGRGLDYTLSMEGALKLKEISYIHAEAYAAGELKHGTIALIDDGVPVIAIATQSDVYSKVISNIQEVKARGAYVILISKDQVFNDKKVCDVHIPIPEVKDEFSVFESAAVFQLLAYYTSTGKGLNPDQPRNLAKAVTVE